MGRFFLFAAAVREVVDLFAEVADLCGAFFAPD